MNKIYCDACETDLSSTSNSIDWRIVLSSERMPIDNRFPVTDIHIYPPFEGVRHFCTVRCLNKWLNGEKND